MARRKLPAGFSNQEPDFTQIVKTNKNFRSNFQSAVTYAHYELSALDLKKETIRYLKDLKNPLMDKVKEIDERRFSSIGKYLYVINHKGEAPEDILANILPSLEKIVSDEEEKIAAKGNSKTLDKKSKEEIPAGVKTVVSIQERLRDKARSVAGEIEGWLDDFVLDKKSDIKSVEEFVGLFKKFELKSPHMRHMQEIFSRRADEMLLVVEGKDKDLLEGYSNFSKPEMKKLNSFYQNLLKATDMLQESAKAVRAPRKKKPVSQEKIIAKLKYKKEDNSLGIVSQNPIQILGSKEVWIYNTKTRKLAQYKAADIRGLTVKGASLENYSTDSKEKTVRKPAETLAEFKKASKVKLRTFLADLSTLDVPAPGKLNEHCVILRIDK